MIQRAFQLLQSCQKCYQQRNVTETLSVTQQFNIKTARKMLQLKSSKSDYNLALRSQFLYKKRQESHANLNQIPFRTSRSKEINSRLKRVSLNQQGSEKENSTIQRKHYRLQKLQKSAEQRDFFLAKLQWKIKALKKDLTSKY